MSGAAHELKAILYREIQAAGSISCARFMELALYHPLYGYYHHGSEQIGCQGDFYTSVSVGPLFGRLLAWQCAHWIDTLLSADSLRQQGSPPHPVQLVEAGAHQGQLALDILRALQELRPDLLRRIEYWILEPAQARRASQQRCLEAFLDRVRWFSGWAELPQRVDGVILSNELLDAFPIFRIGWAAEPRRWFEWRVITAGDRFVWTRSLPTSPEVISALEGEFFRGLPDELMDHLPDGYTLEISPAARQWWLQSAAALAQGYLITFDYGLEAAERLAPHRLDGTLRAYRKHRIAPDPLVDPGTQDLTAHVDFTDIRQAGERAGLRTSYFGSQSGFLMGIVRQAISESPSFGPLLQRHARQLQTLTHPDHLGRAFQVLVQSRP